MRWLTVILIVALILLQTRLWFGEGSLFEYSKLENKLEFQKEYNEILESRNQLMVKDIQNLKNDGNGIEESARKELGMIKEGETFYLVTDGATVNGASESSKP